MLTVLHVVSMISNSQVVFSKKFSIYAIFNDHMLTNNILSFEQLGADYLFVCSGVFCCFCLFLFFFNKIHLLASSQALLDMILIVYCRVVDIKFSDLYTDK